MFRGSGDLTAPRGLRTRSNGSRSYRRLLRHHRPDLSKVHPPDHVEQLDPRARLLDLLEPRPHLRILGPSEVALEPSGRVRDSGWAVGAADSAAWICGRAEDDTLVFIDAPLVVTNATGQRLCETHVGQRYWRWRVSANSTNTASRRLGGVALLRALEGCGFRYDDGSTDRRAQGGAPASATRTRPSSGTRSSATSSGRCTSGSRRARGRPSSRRFEPPRAPS